MHVTFATLALAVLGPTTSWAAGDGEAQLILASVDFTEIALDDSALSQVRGEGLDAIGPSNLGGDETAVILWDEERSGSRDSHQDVQVGSFASTPNTAVSFAAPR